MKGYGTRKDVAEKVDHIIPIKKMYSLTFPVVLLYFYL